MRPTDTLDRQTSIKKLREFSHHWNTQISQWKAAGLSNVERQYAQPFWTDFLACFGINASRIALFERRAQRANTQGAGFIDFFMPAMVIGEAKSLGRDLDKAQEQVGDYLAGGSMSCTRQQNATACSPTTESSLKHLTKKHGHLVQSSMITV